MRTADFQPGLSELRAARRASLGLFWWVGLFSIFTNILILTGPIYMLQVYDRVLISQSLPTLVAITCLAGFLYAVMGLLDHARGRIMVRIGARFQHGMERRVFDAMLRNDLAGRNALQGQRQAGPQQLEAVQRLMTSQAVLALFDLPWVPIFAIGITMFHPWLGALAFGGGALLVLLALGNQILTRRFFAGAHSAGAAAMAFGAQIGASVETVHAVGLRDHAFARWHAARDTALSMQVHAADVGGSMTVSLKTCKQRWTGLSARRRRAMRTASLTLLCCCQKARAWRWTLPKRRNGTVPLRRTGITPPKPGSGICIRPAMASRKTAYRLISGFRSRRSMALAPR